MNNDYHQNPNQYRRLVKQVQKFASDRFHSLSNFVPNKNGLSTSSCKDCDETISINELTNEISGNVLNTYCLSQQFYVNPIVKDFRRESQTYRRLTKELLKIVSEYDHELAWINGGTFEQIAENMYVAHCKYCNVIAYTEVKLGIVGGKAIRDFCKSDLPRGLSSVKLKQKLGQCESCGKPKGDNGTLHWCRVCADKENARKKETSNKARQNLKASGRCNTCGEPIGEDGTEYRCRPCANLASSKACDKQIELQKDGKCIRCKKDRGEDGNKFYCRECNVKANTRKAAKYKERKDSGKCMDCANERGENGTKMHCRSCADKHNTYNRQRRRNAHETSEASSTTSA